MEAPSLQQLEVLKYSELRKLAKQAGLKANLKADRLLKALKKHFHPSALSEQLSDDSDGNCALSDKEELTISAKEGETSVCNGTNRHGRGKRGIQKESTPSDMNLRKEQAKEAQTSNNEKSQEGDSGKIGEEASRPDFVTRQRKRRGTEAGIPETTSDSKEKAMKIKGGNASVAAPPGGKIPRYAGRLSTAESKPSTPNFKKLHEAHFKKMESIDRYMERKQKRLDAVSNSIQQVKMLARNANLLTHTEKTPNSGSKKSVKKSNLMAQKEKTPNSSKKSLQSRYYLFSPAPQKLCSSPAKTPANRRRSGRSSAASKSILIDKSAFKPAALSVSKMNVRFSKATKDNEHKRSLIKTPARKSSFGALGSDSRKSSTLPKNNPESDTCKSLIQHMNDSESDANRNLALRKDEAEANTLNQSATTPYKFMAQVTATPSTNKKFDLQASLGRTLGYQPHKGKLKPWNSKENQPAINSHVSALKSNFKQPPLSSRDDRRRQREEDRRVKRDKTVGTRRGIVP